MEYTDEIKETLIKINDFIEAYKNTNYKIHMLARELPNIGELVKNLATPDVVGQSEQVVCPDCKGRNIEVRHREQSFRCKDCKEGWAN